MEDKPVKLIHIVTDLDAKAIAKGYYEDLSNDQNQCFIGISDIENLVKKYYLEPTIDQTYVYNISSLSYNLLDDTIERKFSEQQLQTYVNVLQLMGATSVEGTIKEVAKKERSYNVKVGMVVKVVGLNAEIKKQKEEELSRTIFIKRDFREKNTKSIDEIEKYLITRGLMNDTKLKGFLEELKNNNNQQLKGTYKNTITLTHNLNSILDIAFQASITPFFKANTSFQQRCSSQTEVFFDLSVSF